MPELSFQAQGSPSTAIENNIEQLVDDNIVTRIFDHDATLWGPEAADEASRRLGWTIAPRVIAPDVPRIVNLSQTLTQEGLTRIVLCGMGGSSLAPEVFARTAGVDLVVIDSTQPSQVRSALKTDIEKTVAVISSKSGGTAEMDSLRRAFTAEFEKNNIDPASRFVVVTDPGSGLEKIATDKGYRAIFLADPNVGGRYSAFTAFGMVPAGLAGVDIEKLLNEAEETLEALNIDEINNIAACLGCVLGAAPSSSQEITHRDKAVIVNENPNIIGFGNWAEQLLAESTGKDQTGTLPVVVENNAPEAGMIPEDSFVVRLVDASQQAPVLKAQEIAVGGNLPTQMIIWELATAVAGYLLKIDPFNQPDVESTKIVTREILEKFNQGETDSSKFVPLFTDGNIQVQVSGPEEWIKGVTTVSGALKALNNQLSDVGYLSIQAYLDRLKYATIDSTRPEFAALTGRPVTFGWGPRFLHSTGQYHKGGPAEGVFLQISTEDQNLPIPGMSYGFQDLIMAQATADAQVLGQQHDRPVLRLHFTDTQAGMEQFIDAATPLAV